MEHCVSIPMVGAVMGIPPPPPPPEGDSGYRLDMGRSRRKRLGLDSSGSFGSLGQILELRGREVQKARIFLTKGTVAEDSRAIMVEEVEFCKRGRC